jgi:large subunit ribosomal protein L16
MLRPKQTKFRKYKKGKIKGNSSKNLSCKFGLYGLKAVESGRITARQIEAARITITRKIKRKGKLWIKVFPYMPVTNKPIEVRMGKGKGSVSYFVAPVKAGSLLYEIGGVPKEMAVQALKSGSNKLPIDTRVICKSN